MKKLVSILAIAITVPALATDITGSSDCDNDTLGTYSAPVDMEAKWTANTINLQWYDDANDTTPATNTCTYNTNITLPQQPSKPGYNFGGWQLRQQDLFDLSTLAQYIDMRPDAAVGVSRGLDGNCRVRAYSTVRDCSDPMFNGLNVGEWRATFDYGTVKGVGLCSSTAGDRFMPGTPDETGTGNTYQCWCKTTGFMESNSSTFKNVVPVAWVAIYIVNPQVSYAAEYCHENCANSCNYQMNEFSNFRTAVYGIDYPGFPEDA